MRTTAFTKKGNKMMDRNHHIIHTKINTLKKGLQWKHKKSLKKKNQK